MAATNYTPIQLYYSTTASAAPTAGNLVNGELAINITDGKLYYKDNGGNVQVIATKGAGTIGGSNTQIQFNDGGALAGNAAMVFNKSTNVTTLTTLNLTNALGATYGGTAQSAYAQGDLLYASAVNTLSKLTIGTVNYILTSTGSVPQWVAPSSVTVQTANNLAGGAAGSVPYQSAADTTTFLAIGAANRVMTSSGSAPQWVTSLTGLTGVSSSSMTNTSLTSGRLVYSTTGGAQTDSANLTFNGTTLSMTGLSNTGFSTIVKTVTLGDSNFNGSAVFAPATPAKLYIGTGTVTDVTSAASATNTAGAITAFGITPIAATNTSVTYTNASTLYIAGAPTAGTNVTITNPYAFYVAGGASYFGGAVDFAVTPSYSGGTANGVMYLNASKQITTGTALTFDGTTLANINSDGTGFSTQSAASNFSIMRLGTDSVNGYAFFQSGKSGTGTTLPFAWRLDSSEQMRLTSTGLGIGTSSPAAKLDVNGTGLVSSFGSNTVAETYVQVKNGTSTLYLGGSSSYNYVYGTASVPLTFWTNSAERMRLDSSGNLGLGVTPSAWQAALGKVIQLGTGASLVGDSGAPRLRSIANAYFDGSNWRYIDNGYATYMYQNGSTGETSWQQAVSGTAGSTISWTQAMTLDANGNLLVGATSSAVGYGGKGFTVYNATFPEIKLIDSDTGGSSTDGTSLALSALDFIINNRESANIILNTANTERARIDSSGNFGIGATSMSLWGTASNPAIYIKGTNSGYAGRSGALVLASYDGLTNVAVANDSGSGALQFYIGTSEKMRLDVSGNLLVGAPSTDVSTARANIIGSGGLAVQYGATTGTFLQVVPGAANGTVDLKYDARSGAYPDATFYTGGTEKLRLTTAGYLGLGTGNPGAYGGRFVVVNSATYPTTYLYYSTSTSQSVLNLNYEGGTSFTGGYKAGINFGSDQVPNGSYSAQTKWFVGINATADGVGDATLAFYDQKNGVQRMTLDMSNRLLVGTTSSGGATSNIAPVVAGAFRTQYGVTSIASTGVATTVMTFNNNDGDFIVSMRGSGTGAPTTDDSVAIICVNAGNASQTDLKTGSNIVISMSGLNLQVTQSLFATANVSWSVMRISA